MMKVIALSRLFAEKVSGTLEMPHAIISIGEPKRCKDERLNKAEFADNEHRKGVLYLQFYDLDMSSIEDADVLREIQKEYGHGLMTDDRANQILDFVEGIKDEVELIVCHCEAGVSRSSAVAAAVLRILTGSDNEIFNDRRYIPNRFVYRKILNAWEERKANENGIS
jgi:predicted protein tyrosine phosphatase